VVILTARTLTSALSLREEFVQQFRLGGFFVLAAIREIAPFVTAIVVLGAAGSAITADLGSRKIREELDAL
jgi:ABC-type transporter Mla maintaining outer membrane lipid asymmetry permease subunit MlaE